jgi:hypothetical protein
VLGWEVGVAISSFLAGTQIQGLSTAMGKTWFFLQVLTKSAAALLVLNYPETYVFKSWHGTLLTIAILSLSVTFNTFFAQKLHLVVPSLYNDLYHSPALIYTLGNRRLSSARSRLLLHPYHTLGTRRESSLETSVGNLL